MSNPREYWTPPVLWPGGDVFVIGGGASLLGFDWDPYRDRHVIGCNDAYLLGGCCMPSRPKNWVDVCCFGDPGWFNRHQHALHKFPGLVVSLCSTRVHKHWVKQINRWPEGFCGHGKHMAARVAWNWSTGASAINLATKLGANRVFLLGFDLKARTLTPEEAEAIITPGTSLYEAYHRYDPVPDVIFHAEPQGPPEHIGNWHPNPINSPDGLVSGELSNRFRDGFDRIRRELKRFPDVQVYNAGPDSALDVFPRITPEEALCMTSSK
jgi:hypothetical protein